MGYKRPARVAFLSNKGGKLAQCAAHFAQREGIEWMAAIAVECPESKARIVVTVPQGAEKVALNEPQRELLEHQDLLVSLDGAGREVLRALRLTVATRHYDVDILPATDQIAAIEQRVKGMLAGMRMFGRAEFD